MSIINKNKIMWDGTESCILNVSACEGNISVFTYGSGSATFKVSKDGIVFTERFLVRMKDGDTNSTITTEDNYITFIGDAKYAKFDNVSGFEKIEASTY